MAPNKEEREAFALQVVDYFVKEADRNKRATVKYFRKQGINRKRIYGIIKRFNENGTHKYPKANGGAPPRFATPENATKLINLYNLNPALSVSEAAQLMNAPKTTVYNLMQKLRRPSWRKKHDSGLKHANAVKPEDWQAEMASYNLEESGEALLSQAESSANNNIPKSEIDFELSYDDDLSNFFEEPCASEKARNSSKSATKVTKQTNKTKQANLQECLLCRRSVLVTKKTTTFLVSENLKVIYMLKKLIEISSDELQFFLTNTSGSCPAEWFTLCDICQNKLDEAFMIHAQILKLERKLYEYKKEILNQIKSVQPGPNKKSRNKRIKKEGKSVSTMIRETVMSKPEEPEGIKNPWEAFKRGDEEAETRLKQFLPPPVSPASPTGLADVNEDFSMDNTDNNEHITEPSFGSLWDSLNHYSNEEKVSASGSAVGKTTSTNLDSFTAPPVQLPLIPEKALPFCEICGENVKYVNLSYHKLHTHGILMEGFTLYHCDVPGCKYSSLSPTSMKNHQKTRHSPDKPLRRFPCQYCGKEFWNKSLLRSHEDIHKNAETKPYTCAECGKGFAVKTYLYIHTRQTHQKRKFPSQLNQTRKKTLEVHETS